MAEDKIAYSDIVQPDDSLNNLIKLLSDTNQQYSALATNITTAVEKLEKALKRQSGATKEGQKAIKQAAAEMSTYEKLILQLNHTMSELGQKETLLRAQISEVNKQTVSQSNYSKMLSGSYEKLAADLKNVIGALQAMSPAMLTDANAGGALIQRMETLYKEMSRVDNVIMEHLRNIKALETAERQLAATMTQEGQQTILTREATRQETKAIIEAERVSKLQADAIARMRIEKQRLIAESEKLTLSELKNTAAGQQLTAQIQALDAEIKSAEALYQNQKVVIDEITRLSERLDRAKQRAGQAEVALQAEIARTNQATREAIALSNTEEGSRDRLAIQLKQAIANYRALGNTATQADRTAAINNIINLRAAIKSLDDALKPATVSMSKLQKAEQELVYLRDTQEGQQYLATRQEIAKLIAAKRELKDITQRLGEAQAKLTIAQQKENVQLKSVELQTRQANETARWQAQLNMSAAGSYNALQAQYQLNIIKLNEMSKAERDAAAGTGGLVQQTQDLYNQMRKLQEQTGNYIKNVGNYKQIWNGLGFSVTQVVRELPALAVSANTFFLAISNNIPMIIDEVKKIRKENEALARSGQKTKSVWKEIGKSLFSFNTALVLVLTALTLWGKDIVEWVGNLGKARGAVMSLDKALSNIHTQLIKGAEDYAKNRVSLSKLSTEWKALTSDKEKLQFIKDNKTAFDQLDVSVNNVADAENLLVTNTETFIMAMKLRAKASAAAALAQEQYQKALEAEAKMGYYQDIEGNQKNVKSGSLGLWSLSDLPFKERMALAFTGGWDLARDIPLAILTGGMYSGDMDAKIKERQEALAKDVKGAEDNAQQYIDIFEKYFQDADAALKAKSLDSAHKNGRKGREPRDLTDTIARNDIEIRKKYETSITNLIQEEYSKRKSALEDALNNEIAKLDEKERKNIDYLKNINGKYKELTDDQKLLVMQQQDKIEKARINIIKKYNYDLEQLNRERQINSIGITREALNWSAPRMEMSLNQERDIKMDQLDTDMRLELATNTERSEHEIIQEFNIKKLKLYEEYFQKVDALYEADNKNRLELVTAGTKEELDLLLEQNELARRAAISQNRAKPAAERVSESQLNQVYDQKALTIKGTFTMTNFDQIAAAKKAEFEIAKHTQDQITEYTLKAERDRLTKQLELVKQGMLKWNPEQIAEAENRIKGIDRELDELNNIFAQIGKKGLGTTLLEKLGLNSDQIDALTEAVNIVLDNIKAIYDAEVKLAEKMVELAEERVSAAQSAYDAEVEARNNGYANNVATARRELELEKKNQREKQKILEEAQARQEQIDSLTQASSLITASANIWSVFSKMGIAGPLLAGAAIAAMWTSFTAAKIKAKQVTSQIDQMYGEGGFEILEGGSHASGNDIDLQTTNKKGRNMRAEGGEAIAIINKRNTRKYRKILPEVIESLNKGFFEDKYLKAFDGGKELSYIVNNNSTADLTTLESEVRQIRKQGASQYYVLPNGDTVIITGNVKRIIRK